MTLSEAIRLRCRSAPRELARATRGLRHRETCLRSGNANVELSQRDESRPDPVVGQRPWIQSPRFDAFSEPYT